MTAAHEILTNTLLRAIAPKKRVLLVNTSFDTLTVLAVEDVKELVHIGPDADPGAPASKTPTGARLHLRPDWQERPRSKDLIVDPGGHGEWVDVDRVLKKHGIYLTTSENAVTSHLPYVKHIKASTLGLLWANCTPKRNALPSMWRSVPAAEGPNLVMGSRHDFETPALYAAWPMLSHVEELARLSRRDDDEKQLTELRSSLDESSEALQSARSELREAQTAIESARRSEDDLRTQMDALTAQMEAQSQAYNDLNAEQTSLIGKYDEVRQELASRRAQVLRADRVDQRVEGLKGELLSELNTLRNRLREIDATAADSAELATERDLYRTTFHEAATQFSSLLKRSLNAETFPEMPPPGIRPEQRDALSAWFHTISELLDVHGHQVEQREQKIRSMRAKLAASSRRIKLLETSSLAVSRPAKARSISLKIQPVKNEALAAQVEALSQALESERILRRHAEQRARDLVKVSERTLEERTAVAERLEAALMDSTGYMTQLLVLEESLQSLDSEMQQKNERIGELEEMLGTHHRLQSMMSEAMRAAETARDEAETARRLADDNLKIMRREFERLQSGR